MLNKQLESLIQGALACQDIKGKKFAYALQKNINYIKREMKRIQDMMIMSDDFQKFDEARVALAIEHAEKDKDGNPVVEGNKYKLVDEKKFEKAIEKLKKEHLKAVDEYEYKAALVNAELEKECTIKFHKVEEMPEDVSLRQIQIISSFMFDEESSAEIKKKQEQRKDTKFRFGRRKK